MFSGASNSRSLQAIYLKFAEYVDILVQIIYAKFKNDRTKNSGDTGCMKMEKNFFSSGNLFKCSFLFSCTFVLSFFNLGKKICTNMSTYSANFRYVACKLLKLEASKNR